MRLRVNGTEREVPADATLQNLIEQLGLAGKRIAIELNGAILPRSHYADTRLSEGDRVEIIQAIGGG